MTKMSGLFVAVLLAVIRAEGATAKSMKSGMRTPDHAPVDCRKRAFGLIKENTHGAFALDASGLMGDPASVLFANDSLTLAGHNFRTWEDGGGTRRKAPAWPGPDACNAHVTAAAPWAVLPGAPYTSSVVPGWARRRARTAMRNLPEDRKPWNTDSWAAQVSKYPR